MLIAQRPTLTEEQIGDARSRFVIEPLEPGFGYTIGNSLRRTLLAAGNAPETLRVGALMGAMKSDLERPRSQTSVWHQVGISGDEPSFILNPRYWSPLIDADLLDQERARYAEQRTDQLRDRFLPATRWFTGRHAALTELSQWLGNPTAPGAAVVTGHAGSGKTALLGLLAALSDPDQAPGIPRDGLPRRAHHPRRRDHRNDLRQHDDHRPGTRPDRRRGERARGDHR